MNRSDYGRDLFSNIEISENMKRELYTNCRNGKRGGDFRFRHAIALTVMITLAIMASTGVAVKAAYDSVAKRMAEMPAREVQSYTSDILNDTGITMDDSWSRKLTDREVLRLAELERKYYDEGVFPDQEVLRLETLKEWDGQSLCYVEEDHLLHLPEPEMTDEQLLLFIDYSAKKDYLINTGVADTEPAAETDETETDETETVETETDETQSPYVDVDHASQQDIIDLAYTHLEKFFGKGLDDEWNPTVEAFQPSIPDPQYGTYHDMYTVSWERGTGSPNGTRYVVVLGMHDLDFRAVAVDGREHWATLGSYSDEDAIKMGKENRRKVLEMLADLYGYNREPDRERMEVYHEYDSYGDARQILYYMYFGDEEVSVMWDLSDERASSVEIYDESK